MSTWEERMSAKAKARIAEQEAQEAARDAARLEALRATFLPPVHPDESGPREDPGHEGHYTHWTPAHGNSPVCSCVEIAGTFTVGAIPKGWKPPERCEICDARVAAGRS